MPPTRPLSAHRRLAMIGPPPAPSRPEAAAAGRSDDAGRVTTLLVVFTAAMLVVVAALVAAAYVDTWWALAVAMVVHVAMTVVDFAGVAYVLTGRVPRGGGRSTPGG